MSTEHFIKDYYITYCFYRLVYSLFAIRKICEGIKLNSSGVQTLVWASGIQTLVWASKVQF